MNERRTPPPQRAAAAPPPAARQPQPQPQPAATKAPTAAPPVADRPAAKVPEIVTSEPQALARSEYKYQALAPIGSMGTLKALLEGQRASLLALLPRHLTPDRLFRTLLVAANRMPDLLKCTQASIVDSVGRAAELGLDVSGTLQEAWILPFRNKVKYTDAKGIKREDVLLQATLIPGYRGLAKLGRQSGEVSKIEANAVKEHDHFEIEYGSNAKLVFRPKTSGDRGRTIGCYAYIRLKDGQELVDYMTFDDIERIRRMSKQPNSLMWTQHWDEGGRKTVFRRLSKWAPLSAEKFRMAIDTADVEYDLQGLAQSVEIAPGGSRSEGLADRLDGKAAGAIEGPGDIALAPAEEEDGQPAAAAAQGQPQQQQAAPAGVMRQGGPPWEVLDEARFRHLSETATACGMSGADLIKHLNYSEDGPSKLEDMPAADYERALAILEGEKVPDDDDGGGETREEGPSANGTLFQS